MWIYLVIGLMLQSCTYNISMEMAHTEGQASDVIDDTQSITPTTDLKADVNIPVKPL